MKYPGSETHQRPQRCLTLNRFLQPQETHTQGGGSDPASALTCCPVISAAHRHVLPDSDRLPGSEYSVFHLRTIGLKCNSRVSRVDHVRYFNQLLRSIFSPEGRASLPLGREFCLLAGRIHLLLNVVCVCVCVYVYIYRRYKRRGFNPWVGNIPWRRKWQVPSSWQNLPSYKCAVCVCLCVSVLSHSVVSDSLGPHGL